MGRKKKKARRREYSRMTLREMCNKAGITPKQRIMINRYMKNKKVGEV